MQPLEPDQGPNGYWLVMASCGVYAHNSLHLMISLPLALRHVRNVVRRASTNLEHHQF
jgi:hypothetical protein